MFSLNELLPYYPFTPPAYFHELAETYIPDASPMPLVSDAEFAAVQTATGMDEACFATLKNANQILFADKQRNAAARFLRAVLLELRKPWENHLYVSPLFRIPGIPDGTTELLFVTAALGYTLTVRKPPADLNEENLNAYRGYTRSFTEKNGYWGIGECHWNLLCASGCMFLFHTLKFQPEAFSRDFLVLTDGKSYRTLLRTEQAVAPDGSLTAKQDQTAFRTSFAETEDAYLAHEVLPNGKVLPTREAFPKSTYRIALQGGDMTLGFHIPGDKPYTPEHHRTSMRQALEFYQAFYPDTDFKAIVCYSWLYSAQNKFLLPENSRILELQRCVHLCPMTAELDETLSFIRKGSSLQKRLAEFRAAGNAYHVGYMYSPISEALTFGDYRHEL